MRLGKKTLILIGSLLVLVVIGNALRKTKSSPNTHPAPSISVPEAKASAVAPLVNNQPVGVYVGVLRTSRGENLECLQWGIEASDQKSLEPKIRLKGKTVSPDKFRAALTEQLKKRLSKRLSSKEWSFIGKCSTEGVLGSCITELAGASDAGTSLSPLRVAYNLDIAISMRQDCRSKGDRWSETAAFVEAMKKRTIVDDRKITKTAGTQ